METGNNKIICSDGTGLFFQWQCVPKPRGIILCVHGIGEHIGRYQYLENWFCEQGYSCYGYDQRGHGKSDGRRTHIDDFSVYIDDLEFITSEVIKTEPNRPLYLYAHSMGAVVALLSVLRNPDHYSGLVIASPAISIGTIIPVWLLKTGRILSGYLPKIRVPSLITAGKLTHDAEVIEQFNNDSLVINTVTLGWLASFLKAQDRVLELAPNLSIPLLVLHSQDDPVANIKGTYLLIKRLPKGKVTFHEYKTLFHELHNEAVNDRNFVLNDMRGWLNTQS